MKKIRAFGDQPVQAVKAGQTGKLSEVTPSSSSGSAKISWGGFPRRSQVGLNVSATDIKIVLVKDKKVKKWASAPLPTGSIRDGLVVQPEAVGKVIRQLLKTNRIPGRRVTASLAGLTFTYRFFSLPRVKDSLMNEAVYRAAKKEFALPLEELYLSWRYLPAHGDTQPVFVLGVPRNLINAFSHALKFAALTPRFVDLRPLALARAVCRENFIAANLENDSFDIVFVAGGTPGVIHTINPRGAGATLEDNIKRLAGEITKTAAYYNRTHPEQKFGTDTPLFLSGDLVGESAAAALLQTELSNPIKLTFPRVVVPAGMPFSSYALTAGLALKNRASGHRLSNGQECFYDINVDLLAGKKRRPTSRLPGKALALTGGLASIIALLILLVQARVGAGNINRDLRTELQDIERRLTLADSIAAEVDSTKNSIHALLAEAEAFNSSRKSLIEARGAISEVLATVTGILPPNARFISVDVENNQVNIQGEAASPFTAVDYATALKKTGYFRNVRIHTLDDTVIFSAVPDVSPDVSTTGIIFTILVSK